ncbi:MAG: hypothetical protein B6244_08080, partial [Candidatus Cloacimonetes bacterium 4572_55]
KKIDINLTETFPDYRVDEVIDLALDKPTVIPTAATPTLLGSVVGSVTCKEGEANFRVGLLGTDHFVWTDPIDGSFRLNDLSLGYYRLGVFDENQKMRESMDVHLTTEKPVCPMNIVIVVNMGNDLSKDASQKEQKGSIFGNVRYKDEEKPHKFRVGFMDSKEFVWTNPTDGSFYFNELSMGYYPLVIYDENQNPIENKDIHLTEVFPTYRVDERIGDDPPPEKPGMIYGSIKLDKDSEHSFRLLLSPIDKYIWTNPKDGGFVFDDLDLENYQLIVYDSNKRIVKTMDINLSVLFPSHKVEEVVSIETAKDPISEDPTETKSGMIYGSIKLDKDSEHSFRLLLSPIDKYIWTNPKDGGFVFDDLDLGKYRLIVFDNNSPSKRIVKTVDIDLSLLFPIYQVDEIVSNYDLDDKNTSEETDEAVGSIMGKFRYKDDRAHKFRVGLLNTENYVWTNPIDGSFSLTELPLGYHELMVYNENKELQSKIDVNLTKIFPTHWVDEHFGEDPTNEDLTETKPGIIHGSIKLDKTDEHSFRLLLSPINKHIWTNSKDGGFTFDNLDLGNYQLIVYDNNSPSKRIVKTMDINLSTLFPSHKVEEVVSIETAKDPISDDPTETKPGIIHGFIKLDKTDEHNFRLLLSPVNKHIWTNPQDGGFTFDNLDLGNYQLIVYDNNSPSKRIVKTMDIDLSVLFPIHKVEEVVSIETSQDHHIADDPIATKPCMIYGHVKTGNENEEYSVRLFLSPVGAHVWTNPTDGGFTFDNLDFGNYQLIVYNNNKRIVKKMDIDLTTQSPIYQVQELGIRDLGSGDNDAEIDETIGSIIGKFRYKDDRAHKFRVGLLNTENYVWTNPQDGSFNLTGLPLGYHELMVYDEFQKLQDKVNVNLTKIFPTYWVDKRLGPTNEDPAEKKSGMIYGTIIHENKNEIKNHKFRLYLSQTGEYCWTNPKSGGFRFDNLDLDNYQIIVYDQDQSIVHTHNIHLTKAFPSYEMKEIIPDVDHTPDHTMGEIGVISGVVKCKKADRNKFRVGFLSERNAIPIDPEDGSFSFSNLPFGHHSLAVYGENNALIRRIDVTLTEVFPVYRIGEIFCLDHEKNDPSVGKIFGNIQQKGKDTHRFWVGFGADNYQWTNPTDGSFFFPDLEFGHYQFVVYHENQSVALITDIHLTPIFPTYRLERELSESTPANSSQSDIESGAVGDTSGSIVGRITRAGEPDHYYRAILSGTDKIISTNAEGNFAIYGLKLGAYSVQIFDSNTHKHVKTVDLTLDRVFPQGKLEVDLPEYASEHDIIKPAVENTRTGMIYGKVLTTGNCPHSSSYRIAIGDTAVTTSQNGSFTVTGLPFGINLVRVYDRRQRLCHAADVQLSKLFPEYQLIHEVNCEDYPNKGKALGASFDPNSMSRSSVLYGRITMEDGCDADAPFRVAIGDTSVTTTLDHGSFEIKGVRYGEYLVRIYDMSQRLIHARDIRLNSVFTSYRLIYVAPCPKRDLPQQNETQIVPKNDPRNSIISGQVTHLTSCEKSRIYRVAISGSAIRDTAISTERDGSFLLSSLPYGAYIVRIYDVNRKQVHGEDLALNSLFSTGRIELNLDCMGNSYESPAPGPGRIVGKIVKKGETDHFYRIRVVGTDHIVSTDISGNFEMSGLDLGMYHLVVYNQDQYKTHEQNVDLTEIFPIYYMNVELDADQVLPPDCMGQIAGSITAEGSKTHLYKVVVYGDELEGEKRVASTNSAGSFVIDGLKCGAYFVTVYDMDKRQVHLHHAEINDLFPIYHIDVKLKREKDPAKDNRFSGWMLPHVICKRGWNPHHGLQSFHKDKKSKDQRECVGRISGKATKEGATTQSYRVVLAGDLPKGKERVVSTNPDGSFIFDKIKCGSYYVTIYDMKQNQLYSQHVEINHIFPIYELDAPIPPDDIPTVVKPECNGKVLGKITHGDKKARQYRVVLTGSLPESAQERVVTTNQSGNFGFDNLPCGSYFVTVYDMDKTQLHAKQITIDRLFPVQNLTIDLNKKESEDLPPKEICNGKILGKITIEGKPAYPYSVVLTILGGSFSDGVSHKTAVTGGDGSFSFDNLGCGFYSAAVLDSDHKPVHQQYIQINSIPPVYIMNVELENDSSEEKPPVPDCSGKLLGMVSFDGKPAHSYRVVLAALGTKFSDGSNQRVITTNESGSFRFDDLNCDSYFVTIYDTDRKQVHIRHIEISSVFPIYTMKVPLMSAKPEKPEANADTTQYFGKLLGTVTKDGKPVHSYRAVLNGEFPNGSRQLTATTSEAGSFVFSDLAFGSYFLTLYDLDQKQVHIRHIEINDIFPVYPVNVQLKKDTSDGDQIETCHGKIIGTVTLNDKPAHSYRVVLNGEFSDGSKQRVVSTGESGGFTLSGLDCGSYFVTMYNRGQNQVFARNIELNEIFPISTLDVDLKSKKPDQARTNSDTARCCGKLIGTVTKDGKPVHSYRAVLNGEFPNGCRQVTGTTSEAGSFVFNDLVFGNYILTLYDPDQKQVHIRHIEINDILSIP